MPEWGHQGPVALPSFDGASASSDSRLNGCSYLNEQILLVAPETGWQAQVDQRFSEDQVAPKWTAMYAEQTNAPDEHFFRLRRDHALEFVLKHTVEGDLVLDLGCGAAPVVAGLLARGRWCIGVDHSLAMLRNGSRRLRAQGIIEDHLVRGDSVALPFRDQTFTSVLCLGVISYLKDYTRLIEEVARVLKPGGTLMLTFRNMHRPVLSDPWEILARFVRGQPLRDGRENGNWPGRFLDPGRVDRDVLEAGLVPLGFKGIGYGPLTVRGKEVLSGPVSIRLSDGLSSLFGRLGLGWPEHWMTDVSIWMYRKPS